MSAKPTILPSEGPDVRPPTGSELPWRTAQRTALRDVPALAARTAADPQAVDATPDFPLLVPDSFVQRIDPADPADPLLRQVLPTLDERINVPGFAADAVGDLPATRTAGLLQKYAGRALLIVTGACAVHCRYCFRRHYPYTEQAITSANLAAALAAIRADESLHEVLLSGGDPLSLSDERIGDLLRQLDGIDHLRRIRIHTRTPVVLPARVTPALVDVLASLARKVVIVLHSNHAHELTADVPAAIALLRTSGAMLLNQAVLLRGVNDSVSAQHALCERLVELGVVPYYLHQLDRVAGAAHFEVPVAEGRTIIAELRRRLPGYMVPRYVQEIAGEPHKTMIN